LQLFENIEPPTSKEASKTEKLKNKFRPVWMRTKTFIVSFLFNPIWDCRPLYLLGNIQEGKVRKNLGTSTFFLEERAEQ